jgi:hypothetical protein
MASVVTVDFDYTYNGQIATEVLYKPSVQTPDVLQLFKVITGIKNKHQLTLGPVLSNVVKQYSGCNVRTASSGVALDNRTLTVQEMELFVEECKDAWENTIYEQFLASGVDANDIGASEVIKGIIDRIVIDAMRRDNFRLFSFGNENSGNANLNGMTGMWTRLFAGVQDTYCVKRQDDISVLNQTAGTRAIDYFRNLIEGAPIILKQIPREEKAIFVTGNVYENFQTNLENADQNANGVQLVTKGDSGMILYRGIEVVPIYAWDDAISVYSLGSPSRILYTWKQNHVIGVDRTADQGSVRGWYEKKDRKYYIEGQYKMGYNYVHCDLSSVSYGAASNS